jgi:hypothetical protein
LASTEQNKSLELGFWRFYYRLLSKYRIQATMIEARSPAASEYWKIILRFLR